jgi:hypothetical protein
MMKKQNKEKNYNSIDLSIDLGNKMEAIFSESEKSKRFRNIVCKYTELHNGENITHRVNIIKIRKNISKPRLLCGLCSGEILRMYEQAKKIVKIYKYSLLTSLQEYQENPTQIKLLCEKSHKWDIPWTRNNNENIVTCNECLFSKNVQVKIVITKTVDFPKIITLNGIYLLKSPSFKMADIVKCFEKMFDFFNKREIFELKVIVHNKKKINFEKLLFHFNGIFDINIDEEFISFKTKKEIFIEECIKKKYNEIKRKTITRKFATKKISERTKELNLEKENNDISSSNLSSDLSDNLDEELFKKIGNNFKKDEIDIVYENQIDSLPNISPEIVYQEFVELINKRNNLENKYNDHTDYRGEIFQNIPDTEKYILAQKDYNEEHYKFKGEKSPYVNTIYINGRKNESEKYDNHYGFKYSLNTFIKDFVYHPVRWTRIKNNACIDRPYALFSNNNMYKILEGVYEYSENKKSSKKIQNMLDNIRNLYLSIEQIYLSPRIVSKNLKDNFSKAMSKFDGFQSSENWEKRIMMMEIITEACYIDIKSDKINPILLLCVMFLIKNGVYESPVRYIIRHNENIVVSDENITMVKKDKTVNILSNMAAHKMFYIDSGALQLFYKISLSFLKIPKSGEIFDTRNTITNSMKILNQTLHPEMFGGKIRSSLEIELSDYFKDIERIDFITESFDILELVGKILGYDNILSLDDSEILEMSRILLIMQQQDRCEYGTLTLALRYYPEKSFIKTIFRAFPDKTKEQIINRV